MANEILYKTIAFIVKSLEIFVIVVVGVAIIQTQQYEISYLIMLTGYAYLLWEPLDEAISHINAINRSWEKYRKLQNFLSQENEIENGTEAYTYKKGCIEFREVDFSYNQ